MSDTRYPECVVCGDCSLGEHEPHDIDGEECWCSVCLTDYEMARLSARVGEWDAACEEQGLPVGIHPTKFVQHHRSNAALAAWVHLDTERHRSAALSARVAELEGALAPFRRLDPALDIRHLQEDIELGHQGVVIWDNGITRSTFENLRLAAAGSRSEGDDDD